MLAAGNTLKVLCSQANCFLATKGKWGCRISLLLPVITVACRLEMTTNRSSPGVTVTPTTPTMTAPYVWERRRTRHFWEVHQPRRASAVWHTEQNITPPEAKIQILVWIGVSMFEFLPFLKRTLKMWIRKHLWRHTYWGAFLRVAFASASIDVFGCVLNGNSRQHRSINDSSQVILHNWTKPAI